MRRLLTLLLVAGLGHALPLAVTAQSAGFDIEGKYELVRPPQPTESPDKIEVVEIFWYGCPHCFRFLPVMDRYVESKPDYVEVVRMPAIFRDRWAAHARAYYTARQLGVLDKIHGPLFDAIHVKRQSLDSRASLATFFEAHGVSRADFEKTYDSFTVESLVRRSLAMQRSYGIRGTPSVIVNGKYRVSGSLAGSNENMIKVIEVLVEKERQG
jgi:thiol:disulfide interchange protein DsbA